MRIILRWRLKYLLTSPVALKGRFPTRSEVILSRSCGRLLYAISINDRWIWNKFKWKCSQFIIIINYKETFVNGKDMLSFYHVFSNSIIKLLYEKMFSQRGINLNAEKGERIRLPANLRKQYNSTNEDSTLKCPPIIGKHLPNAA